jgi:uncharacterized protein (DUF2267 family)
MEENEFLTDVQRHADLDRVESARTATYATLTALGEVLPEDEAENAASQLPERLAGWMTDAASEESEAATPEAFVETVREREADDGNVDERDARRHTKAVLNTFAAALTPGELADVRANLPTTAGRCSSRPTPPRASAGAEPDGGERRAAVSGFQLQAVAVSAGATFVPARSRVANAGRTTDHE